MRIGMRLRRKSWDNVNAYLTLQPLEQVKTVMPEFWMHNEDSAPYRRCCGTDDVLAKDWMLSPSEVPALVVRQRQLPYREIDEWDMHKPE